VVNGHESINSVLIAINPGGSLSDNIVNMAAKKNNSYIHFNILKI